MQKAEQSERAWTEATDDGACVTHSSTAKTLAQAQLEMLRE